jgi:hypothetical protein
MNGKLVCLSLPVTITLVYYLHPMPLSCSTLKGYIWPYMLILDLDRSAAGFDKHASL